MTFTAEDRKNMHIAVLEEKNRELRVQNNRLRKHRMDEFDRAMRKRELGELWDTILLPMALAGIVAWVIIATAAEWLVDRLLDIRDAAWALERLRQRHWYGENARKRGGGR